MDLKNLFIADYWFQQPSAATGVALWVFNGLFLLMLLVGVGLKIASHYQDDRINKSVTRRFGNFGLTMGLCGLAWMFFRQENVALLGWRLWLFLWAAASLWWITDILRYIVRRAPKLRKEKEEIERIKKYLPG